jgi:hypothetical protein
MLFVICFQANAKLRLSSKKELVPNNKLIYNKFTDVIGYYPVYFPDIMPQYKTKIKGRLITVSDLKFCEQKNLTFNTLDAKNYIANNKIKIIKNIKDKNCFVIVVKRYGY